MSTPGRNAEIEARACILQSRADADAGERPMVAGAYLEAAARVYAQQEGAAAAAERLRVLAREIVSQDKPAGEAVATPSVSASASCPFALGPAKPAVLVAARHYGLTPAEILSRGPSRRVAHPRQVAMTLARRSLGLSYPEIGRRFGGYDHTSVIHAERAVERREAADPAFAAELSGLQRAASERGASR